MGAAATGGAAVSKTRTMLKVRKVRMICAVLLTALLLLLARQRPSQAQSPEQSDAFVFGINASVPGAVIGTFAPPSVDSIYFLADRTSILSPRQTRVYYWPITNEYRAAWSEVNEQVEGTLEILQGSEVVATVQQVTYTIHFSTGERAPRPQLYVGQEALQADARFQEAQTAYREAALAYQAARQAWLAQAREAAASLTADGVDPETLPPAPQQPEALNLFSTGLNSGYPVELPAGSYQIRTRLPDGSIIPESERRLIVFAPRRTAVGYEVVPENRWTFPEELNDLSSAVFGENDSVIYLKPYIVREYPSLPYERLQDPQYVGDTSGPEWMWVSGEPLEEEILEIVRDGRVEELVGLQPYFVRQVPGRELGYEILPYAPDTPDLTPRIDFVGYRIALSTERPAFEVRLRSPEQTLLSGSTRAVRVVEPISVYTLLPLSLLPLIIGAGLLFWRRRRTALEISE